MKAIDVHGHFGSYIGGGWLLRDKFFSGNAELVSSRAKKAGVKLTIVSALKGLLPDGGDCLAGNKESLKVVKQYKNIMGIRNAKIRTISSLLETR
jgi:hypothetical protein